MDSVGGKLSWFRVDPIFLELFSVQLTEIEEVLGHQ